MPDTTSRRAISQPKADRSDPADVPLYIRNVAAAVDSDVVYLETTAAARGAATLSGRIHRATDTGVISFDTGTAWVIIGTNSFGRGTLGARPGAGAVPDGYLYFATNDNGGTLYESDTSNWTKIAPGLTEDTGLGTRHSVRAKQATPQSIPADTSTVVTLDGEDWDSNAFHDIVTNNSRVTIPSGLDGIIIAVANVAFPNPSEAGSWGVIIRKNGTDYLAGGAADYVTTDSFRRHPGATLIDIAVATDYYEILVHQTHSPSGGAATLVSASLSVALLST